MNIIKSSIIYFLLLVWAITIYSFSRLETIVDVTPVYHHKKNTEELIVILSRQYDVNLGTSIRIADCESKIGKFKTNKWSSAKGVYQFIDKTWKTYCEGDVMDDYDNINCFMKLYKKHPSWWECK